MTGTNGELVVLLHGLGRSRYSLWPMERALKAAGFRVDNRSYPSRRHSIRELAAMIRGRLQRAALPGERVHFVSHSLGGLLIRGALYPPLPFAVGRIVMIAPPNRGVDLIHRLRHYPALAHVFGRPTAELYRNSPTLQTLGVPDAEIGVIAGTRARNPFSLAAQLNAALGNEAASDGTVEVDSTKLPGMRDFATVDSSHTFIASRDDVITQVIAFLRHGRFDPGD